MISNYNFNNVGDYLTSIYDNYLPNLTKYDYAILAIHTFKFSLAVSNFVALIRTGHLTSSPYKYTFFTGISISDDIFSIYRQVTKVSYGVYDEVINVASLLVTTASSLALTHTVANQFERLFNEISSSKAEHQKAFDETSKQSIEGANVLTTIILPTVVEGSELSNSDSEFKSASQPQVYASKIHECVESESKLTKSQAHIGTQDYLFFFMNNAKSFTQIQEIIEKKGFDYNLLKPQIITISVNVVMYFGYNKYMYPKLPSSIVGNDKASATFKLVVNTVASIAVTSVLTFGDKLYNLAYNELFGQASSADKKDAEKSLNSQNSHDVPKEIEQHDDNNHTGHEEL
jgi:hypothetical protein